MTDKEAKDTRVRRGYDDELLAAWLAHIERAFLGPDAPAENEVRWPSQEGKRKEERDEPPAWRLRAARNAAEKALWARTLAAAADRGSGLAAFVARYKLTRVETRVVVALLYANLQAEWTRGTTPFRRGLTNPGELMPPRRNAGIKNFRLFGPGSKLFDRDLIAVHGFLTNPHFDISNNAFAALMGYPGAGDDDEDEVVHRRRRRRRGDEDELWEVRKPRVTLDDVILPAATREELEDALFFARNRERLLNEGGLSAVMEKGTGLALLFWGPPGTGKTMAAEAFAAALSKPLCLVRAERVESKWVGETEKNIARLFAKAEKEGALVVFDECDSFFFRRPTDEGHYMNAFAARQVNMLLRGIEEGEGVYILTTNRADFLDEALARRLAARVHFAPPAEEERRALWRRLLPAGHGLSGDELEEVVQRYAVTGGIIKQAALAAARRAFRFGRPVNKGDITAALAAAAAGEDKRMGF